MKKLSDNQVGDRLHAALEKIGTCEGETIRGNTALAAARQTTLRQIIEEGLRAVTGTRQVRGFRLRDGSFGGKGTSVSDWSDVRQAIYEGRGE